jgi:hypothetical protein
MAPPFRRAVGDGSDPFPRDRDGVDSGGHAKSLFEADNLFFDLICKKLAF